MIVKIHTLLPYMLIMAAVIDGSARGQTIAFVNDFSAWTVMSWSIPAGLEPGSWLGATNTDSLKWNLSTNAGAANRGKYYKFTSASTIRKVEFDWRFSNDQFNSRLAFELLDDTDTILWSATSTAGGQAKPLNHAIITTINSRSVRFSYHQTNEVIYGKSAFFDASNQDDWDAFVDNVTLTADDACTAILSGDFNNDCAVDFKDLAVIAQNWQSCSHPDPALCSPGSL